jgi:cell division protein FtsL
LASVAAPARTRTRRPSTKTKAAPRPKPKPSKKVLARRRARARSRAAIAWIVVGALLLGGVVFVNLAVLRLNLRLDKATQEQTSLKAGNAALEQQLSSALGTPRIQALAAKQGLVQADPSTIQYINLGK